MADEPNSMDSDRNPPMTVADLMALLAQLPADLPVLVDAQERGLDYPAAPVVVTVSGDDDAPSYNGRFERSDAPGSIRAVYLARDVP